MNKQPNETRRLNSTFSLAAERKKNHIFSASNSNTIASNFKTNNHLERGNEISLRKNKPR